MGLIERFQELTGITHKEIAEEILQQFDWNIESAVDCFLSDGKPNDSSPVSTQMPPLEPQSRLLKFEIKHHLDDNNTRTKTTILKDIPDSHTFGDLKRLYVNKCHHDLIRLAENANMPSDVASLVNALRFDGMRNPSHLDDDVTLKSLHLPLWNAFTARLAKGPRNNAVQGTSSSSAPLDLRVRLLGSPQRRNGGAHRQLTDSRIFRLKNITNDTSLAELKRSAARESDISTSNQVWSLPESNTSTPGLEALVKDLNMSSNKHNEYKLQRYNLKHNRYYSIELTDSQVPSISQASSSSRRVATTSEVNNRPQRSKKKIHYDASQELDDDPDFIIYSDIDDDPSEDLTLASGSANPYSLPLIPLNLIGSPREALDNFYQVFCQRYCSNPEDHIPPFLLCPFNDIFSRYLSPPYAVDRKPIFIYLHNDRSVAVHIFCNRLLCSQQMNQFLEANELKIWPWDVTLEGARSNIFNWMQPRLDFLVSSINQLQTDQFPLLIMLCKLSGSYEVITMLTGHGLSIPVSSHFWSLNDDPDQAMETFPPLEPGSASITIGHSASSSARGKLDAGDIVNELWQKYVTYQERLQPEIEADSQRVDRELMRREQDRAYEESLEQDRFKVEAIQREKAAVARREEEARLEAELAQREARNRQLSSSRALPPEPPACAEGVTTLRLRLPTSMPLPPSYEHLSDAEKYPIHNGMVARRFKARDTLRDLKNFVESLGYAVANFKLLTTFPRVDLTAHSSDSATLAELKLVPQETIILEQR